MTAHSPSEHGLYAYAITPADHLDLSGTAAIGSAGSPWTVSRDGIGLVVSEIALSVLDGVATAEVTEDGPLAGLARAHDAVVRALAAQTAVLPLRFGTVVTDTAAARRLLRDRRDEAHRLLAHVAGHREWGVRLRPVGAAATAAPPDRRDEQTRPSGTEYLARRRTARTDAEVRRRRTTDLVAATHDGLVPLARDAVRRAAPGALSDVAYLVAEHREAEFLAAAERLAERLRGEHIELQSTGPWPPYSFARTGLEAPDD